MSETHTSIDSMHPGFSGMVEREGLSEVPSEALGQYLKGEPGWSSRVAGQFDQASLAGADAQIARFQEVHPSLASDNWDELLSPDQIAFLSNAHRRKEYVTQNMEAEAGNARYLQAFNDRAVLDVYRHADPVEDPKSHEFSELETTIAAAGTLRNDLLDRYEALSGQPIPNTLRDTSQ